MKRTIVILVLFLFHYPLFSQPFGYAIPGYKVIELRYENSSGEKGTTLFRYDSNNRMTKALWALDDKSRYSLNNYVYDEHGNLIFAFRDFSDGFTSFERFEYDKEGNKISEYFYRSDSVSGSASYTYNNKQLVKAELKKHKGWLSGEMTYLYNSQGRKVKGILTMNGDTAASVTYTYDITGNMTVEFWDFNGRWSQTYNYAYECKQPERVFYANPFLPAESKYRVSKEYYTYNNEVGGPSFYYYNNHGVLTEKVFIRSDSVRTNTLYKHNNGKMSSSIRRYQNGEQASFTFVYDENERLIRRDMFRADTLNGFEAYFYNADNELTKAYYKNSDGWLTGMIDFYSDETGKIKGGTFKGENGFDASLLFEYYAEGMISSIKWVFSFGAFQQYNFEYEPSPL